MGKSNSPFIVAILSAFLAAFAFLPPALAEGDPLAAYRAEVAAKCPGTFRHAWGKFKAGTNALLGTASAGVIAISASIGSLGMGSTKSVGEVWSDYGDAVSKGWSEVDHPEESRFIRVTSACREARRKLRVAQATFAQTEKPRTSDRLVKPDQSSRARSGGPSAGEKALGAQSAE